MAARLDHQGRPGRHLGLLQDAAQGGHVGRLGPLDIGGEMNAVIKNVGFTGDFAAFLQFLRTDPRFYAEMSKLLDLATSGIAQLVKAQRSALE